MFSHQGNGMPASVEIAINSSAQGDVMATELNTSSGSFHDKKQLLVNDVKNVVGDANDILKQVAHSTAEEIAAARTAVTGKAKCVASATNEYVRENPWRTLGIVAAAGLVVGFLLNRR